jgi:hypothetical protein
MPTPSSEKERLYLELAKVYSPKLHPHVNIESAVILLQKIDKASGVLSAEGQHYVNDCKKIIPKILVQIETQAKAREQKVEEQHRRAERTAAKKEARAQAREAEYQTQLLTRAKRIVSQAVKEVERRSDKEVMLGLLKMMGPSVASRALVHHREKHAVARIADAVKEALTEGSTSSAVVPRAQENSMVQAFVDLYQTIALNGGEEKAAELKQFVNDMAKAHDEHVDALMNEQNMSEPEAAHQAQQSMIRLMTYLKNATDGHHGYLFVSYDDELGVPQLKSKILQDLMSDPDMFREFLEELMVIRLRVGREGRWAFNVASPEQLAFLELVHELARTEHRQMNMNQAIHAITTEDLAPLLRMDEGPQQPVTTLGSSGPGFTVEERTALASRAGALALTKEQAPSVDAKTLMNHMRLMATFAAAATTKASLPEANDTPRDTDTPLILNGEKDIHVKTKPAQNSQPLNATNQFEIKFNGLLDKILALKNTEGLTKEHQEAIDELVDSMKPALKTLLSAPIDKNTFGLFNRHCQFAIHRAEAKFDQEPGLWGVFKPLVKSIYAAINAFKEHCLGHSKDRFFKVPPTVVQTAWDLPKAQVLKEIKEIDPTPKPNQ